MLSDEEEAIEKIKKFNQYNWEMNNLKGKEFAKPYFESLDTILNLIEKQSKEIEENKKYLVNLTHEQYIKLVEQIRSEINKEWRDVIKAKVIEIKNRPVKDEFITVTQGKLNTIIEIESLLEKE